MKSSQGKKQKIIFNKKNNKIKLEFIPLDIKKEIESIIVYFLKKFIKRNLQLSFRKQIIF